MAVIAPALARLRTELNVRWPNRDRTTDGWIGDTSHAASGMPENGGSDHNPNRRGIVDAFDIDKDGINQALVVAAAIRHSAVHYVIWARHIWSKDHLGANGLPEQRNYTGSNPHLDHIHISLKQTVAAENSTTAWGIASGTVTTPPVEGTWLTRLITTLPVLEPSATARSSVRKAQLLLNLTGAKLTSDGIFGPLTTAAVKAYQAGHGLTADGVIGPKTWNSLLGGSLPTIKSGNLGNTVRVGQALLNAFGSSLEVDGQFGAQTAASAAAFQARYELAKDSIIGPVTWTALLTR